MATRDLSSSDVSSETKELAWELQQEKPDTYRIKWLIDDMGADVTYALAQANLKNEDLMRKPLLRPLGLQKYLTPVHPASSHAKGAQTGLKGKSTSH